MADTPGNVLTGRAILAIRNPNDALAEWSTAQHYAGNHSVRLYKGGSGNAGSTHVEIVPPAGLTVAALLADPTDYSFWYWYSAVTGNFVQFELKYEDPNSDGWMEVTVMVHQTTLGTGPTMGWLKKALALTDKIGYGGVNETGESFFDYDLADTIAEVISGPLGQAAAPAVGDWVLTRVRLELWEPTPERTAYVDSLEIDGTVYTLEPGGTGPAMLLSAPYTDVGYTDDGVVFEVVHETGDTRVDETPYPIDRFITSGSLRVTCNMAESSLANLNLAIAGSVLSGNLLTLGTGVLRKFALRLVGISPSGLHRQIYLPIVTATGTVSMSYKRAEKTIVPVTFEALKPATGSIFTWVDNAA